jgi:DNA repair protein RecN (Recombination protein N)
MLASLAVRDVVLIDRLALEFAPGLAVLTGETGAGKSILLDALGLALGARAEARLVRQGAQQASVAAVFELPDGHPARALLAEQGIADADGEGGALTLRRILAPDGKSRAFANDQPVSVGLLRQLGDLLVEVQGQFESRGLLDAATHRGLLDAFGGLEAEARRLATAWQAWRALEEAAEAAALRLAAARRDEAFLRHALDELVALDPRAGEEESLAAERQLLLHTGKILEALAEARQALAGRAGAEGLLANALRALDRVAEKAGGRLAPLTEALERALAETDEVGRQLDALSADTELDPQRLERVEERYFALKDLARKHGREVGELPALREELAQKLAALDDGGAELARLRRQAADAGAAWRQAAEALGARRRAAARKLDAAINAELPPLKLERARFQTQVEALPAEAWGAGGQERVAFLVATNPGATPGPLARIASGGELARFLLALKVVLAALSPVPTLVFDEVDAGIGGATAAAVGERLARLAAERQVLVVTHSPQVAARGGQHWRVAKRIGRDSALTDVAALDPAGRREEIARMLSGEQVTDEARQAAAKLLETA